jgi:hypothetical protein
MGAYRVMLRKGERYTVTSAWSLNWQALRQRYPDLASPALARSRGTQTWLVDVDNIALRWVREMQQAHIASDGGVAWSNLLRTVDAPHLLFGFPPDSFTLTGKATTP